MSFANLKSSRGSSIDSLVKAAEAVSTKTDTKSYDDDRFWKPTRDKAGNGYAVIRFLPCQEGEDLPWVRYWDHGFKGPTGLWYIENSLTSIGQEDPVSEANSVLWNTGRDEDKATARERKRRLHYVSNVLIVSDPSNPENEGKVKLYKFGKKIFDKIMDVMQPQFADEDPINPFDFWDGAFFKLKIRQVDGYRNYDKSEFAKPKPLDEDDAVLEGVYKELHSLSEFNGPKNYKTYDELKTKLTQVLGDSGMAMSTAEQVTLEDSISAPIAQTVAAPSALALTADDDDEDETLSYFNQLAAD